MLTAIIIAVALAWVITAALPAYVASERGRDGAAWFFIGLVFGPLLSLLALIALPAREPGEVDETEEMRRRRVAGERAAQRQAMLDASSPGDRPT